MSIKDNGIGISEEKQKKIFKPFEQADNSITRQYGGTGLGLSIAYNVLSLMNSKITLQSSEKIGSTFSFIIDTSYENEKVKLNYIKDLKVLILSTDDINNTKQLEIAQRYLNEYTKIQIQDNLNNIDDFDILLISFDKFQELQKASLTKPTIIINKTKVTLNDFKSSYKFLKTPLNPSKLYDTILNILNIQNTNITEIQHKIRTRDIKFKGNVLIAEDDEINQQLIQIRGVF